jgi:adenosylcobinamide-GDP ribazoletransferase
MLHLDGFIDACDGLLPPRDAARRLEIMKDSRVGAFGVVGVFLLLLLKFNALTALSGMPRMAALIAVPVLARWAMTWAMARYPLARRDGLAVRYVRGLGWTQVGFASIIAFSVAMGLLGWGALLLALATWLTVTLVAQLAVARIDGLTGDIYGAICEVVEVVLLFVIVAYA